MFRLSSTVIERSPTGVMVAELKMPASSAMRIRTAMPPISTPSAVISGVLLARLGVPELNEGSGDDDDGMEIELVIAPLGASVDGLPVPHYQPLPFLEQSPS